VTEARPFCLVYERMAGLDLGRYLGSAPTAGRLKLVPTPIPTRPLSINSHLPCQQLTEVAQGLERMHDMGVVHGNFETVCSPSISRTRLTEFTFASSISRTSLSTTTALLALLVSAMCSSSRIRLNPHIPRWLGICIASGL
jgi:hypothetical protein